MKIKITKEIIYKAIDRSEASIGYQYDRFKLSLNMRKSMIVIGTIGELIFEQYLKGKEVEYEYEDEMHKSLDYISKYEKDFQLNNDIIEIKTSGYDQAGYEHLNLLYSQDQYDSGIRKGFDKCVLIFVNGYDRNERMLKIENCNSATIAGYIPFKDISNYPSQRKYYGDDYKVPIKELYNIETLIK